MPTGRISDKQNEILQFVKSSILSRGYPPTVREICDAVHLKSTSSVHAHLETLEKNGYIRRPESKQRAIEITDDEFNISQRDITNIPVVGTVAAGQPILAEQNIMDYYPIPASMLPKEQIFMLRVKGDSMIEAGIFQNDNIIVKCQNTARNGEIVVALIDDSATVKRFYKENGHIRLQPENSSMDPIIVDNCEILGIVIGLIRMGIH